MADLLVILTFYVNDYLGLASFCKTTGGKGLHVVSLVQGEGINWTTAKAFARSVCRAMQKDAPDLYETTTAMQKRGGKIFLDYLRNDGLATAVAPLSPRGRAGVPVSMPLTWSQVRKGLSPAGYTVRSVPGMLGKMTAWDNYSGAARPLRAAIERLGMKS